MSKKAKITACIMCLTLLFGLLPGITFAATTVLPAGSTEADLRTAISGAASGDVIVISNDITFTGTITMTGNKSITIQSGAGDHWKLSQTTANTRHFTMNGSGSLIFKDITLDGGAAGGGVSVGGLSRLVIDAGAVITNCATTANGGGVSVAGGGKLVMNGGEISHCSANGNGGGIYCANSNTVEINGGTIKENAAANGGGIYLSALSGLSVTGESYFVNNNAGSHGGGIYTANAIYANLTIGERTVFSGNTSSGGYAPPANAAILFSRIKFESVSILDHPLNDYDINNQNGKLIVYHVTYDANGGTGSYTGPNISPGGGDTILSQAATGIYYWHRVFVEWNTQADGGGTPYAPGDAITLNGNVTLYAQWRTKNQLLVTFESNGGSSVPGKTVESGGKVAEPDDPQKLDFIFAGWYTDNGTFQNAWDFDSDQVTANITLYAKWVKANYSVTFECHGGTSVSGQTVAYNGKVVKPDDPTKAGFKFAGWYTDDGTFANAWNFAEGLVTGNLVLYAKWEKVVPATGVDFNVGSLAGAWLSLAVVVALLFRRKKRLDQ